MIFYLIMMEGGATLDGGYCVVMIYEFILLTLQSRFIIEFSS